MCVFIMHNKLYKQKFAHINNDPFERGGKEKKCFKFTEKKNISQNNPPQIYLTGSHFHRNAFAIAFSNSLSSFCDTSPAADSSVAIGEARSEELPSPGEVTLSACPGSPLELSDAGDTFNKVLG